MNLNDSSFNTVIGHELDKIFKDFWYKDYDDISDELKRLLDNTNKNDYFICVDDCLRKLMTTKDPYIVSELVNLTLILYHYIDTTEVTPFLKDNGQAVIDHIKKYGNNASFVFLEFIDQHLKIKELKYEEILDLSSKPIINCYPQGFHHDDAYLAGNREGFIALRQAVSEAIKYNKSTIDLVAIDGTNYQLNLGITPSVEIIELAEMPYSEQYSHYEEGKISPQKFFKDKKDKKSFFNRIRGGN